MTVSMCMIVRDEADTIERCLTSFAEHVDEVIVVDTGSTDDTMGIVWRWFADRGETVGNLILETFEWIDDFAAARAHADSLATGDWRCWVDADDVIHGAQNLRALAASVPEHVAAIGCGYDYAQDEHGNTVVYLRRERLVRAGAGKWTGRVHEAQLIDGPVEWAPPELLEWRHRKGPAAAAASGPRNRTILERWNDDQPDQPRVLSYLGTEYAAAGDWTRAEAFFDRYLALETHWPEERAQVHRKAAIVQLAIGNPDQAIELALQALRVHPTFPDSYLTLAEACYQAGQWDKAADWARRVLELGVPETLLIISPPDYTVQPHVVLAGAANEQGDVETAIAHAHRVLEQVPNHPVIAPIIPALRGRAKREKTAAVVLEAAQVLVAHDEQAKALILLEQAVPYWAVDHPHVVGARSQLRERLLFVDDPNAYEEHYETGGSKPEDFLPDDVAFEQAAALSRCQFLLTGLREQAAA